MVSSLSSIACSQGLGLHNLTRAFAEASSCQPEALRAADASLSMTQLKGRVVGRRVIGRGGPFVKRYSVSCNFEGPEEKDGQRQRADEIAPDQQSASSASSAGSAPELVARREGKAWRETEPGSSEGEDGSGVQPPYTVISLLALAGAAETAYLTWMKLFGNGNVVCPLGGNCNDVLNSEYAVLFGLPLSLYGLVAYSAVALLSQLSRDGHSDHGHSYTRWLLLGATSLMATASGFFLYLLAFKLDTPSCTYCFASAALSISLFLCSGWGFTMKELKCAALPQLALSMGTILAFSLAFGDVRSAQAGSGDIDLLPLEPEVVTVSTPREVALAKHLKAMGAKMYGAFWCSHCYEQKQMFGREAMKYVEYVECYPDGYRRGVQLNPACEAAGVEGFPTWVVNGKVMPGERSLEELAQVSEFITVDK